MGPGEVRKFLTYCSARRSIVFRPVDLNLFCCLQFTEIDKRRVSWKIILKHKTTPVLSIIFISADNGAKLVTPTEEFCHPLAQGSSKKKKTRRRDPGTFWVVFFSWMKEVWKKTAKRGFPAKQKKKVKKVTTYQCHDASQSGSRCHRCEHI